MTVHELPPPTIVWLTKEEAAAHAKMSEGTIDRARRAGELEYSGGGGYAVRIRQDRLDEWLEHRGRREVD
jgi:excisionase family DNA binding protein